MSRLFRILRAAETEVDLLKIGSVLSKTGEEIGLRELAPIIRTPQNILKIGDRTAESLVKSLRAGRVEEAVQHIYRVDHVPESVKLKLLDEVKDLPSAHVGLAEQEASVIKGEFRKTMSEAEYKELSAPDGPPLTVDSVKKSQTLSKIADMLKNTKVISIYTGVVLFGGTTALVVAAVNHHRRELRGCYKFTNTNGTIHSCKEVESSCVNGHVDLHETTRACRPEPGASSSTETCETVDGVGCINCPPATRQRASPSDEQIDKPETLAGHDEFDMVSYHCNNPSNMDALADLLNDKASSVSQALGGIGGAAANAVQTLFSAFRYVFIIMGVIAGLLVVAYGVNRYSIISNDGRKISQN